MARAIARFSSGATAWRSSPSASRLRSWSWRARYRPRRQYPATLSVGPRDVTTARYKSAALAARLNAEQLALVFAFGWHLRVSPYNFWGESFRLLVTRAGGAGECAHQVVDAYTPRKGRYLFRSPLGSRAHLH